MIMLKCSICGKDDLIFEDKTTWRKIPARILKIKELGPKAVACPKCFSYIAQMEDIIDDDILISEITKIINSKGDG